MQISTSFAAKTSDEYPPFSLVRLLQTVFNPQKGEKLCILIDLDQPTDVVNFNFLQKDGFPVQKKAYEVFYQELNQGVMQKLGLAACDLFAYEKTGGSNLELPETGITPSGKSVDFNRDIYPVYQIILCVGDYSATAPLTATAKKFGFRGATMHGLNNIIVQTGLSVDYNQVSLQAERLRKGMTRADSIEVDFVVDQQPYHLHIELGGQEAQKSHGICHSGPDIVNLPAGEVYFVPTDAKGDFPIKFEEDGTLGLMHVEEGKVKTISLIKGNPDTVNKYQLKFSMDPASAILGELGFGTQLLPYSERDIQDEKIFGTFHLATGRNDHLNGSVTLDRFLNPKNATHEDILFSMAKTPDIQVKQVRMHRDGRTEVLIENNEPAAYLWGLRNP